MLKRLLLLPPVLLASTLSMAQPVADPTNPDLASVRNFHRISDRLLTSGQIYPAQIPTLKDEGVDFVVNLAVADPDRNGDEPFAMMRAGINYVNIPVLWDQPTREDLDLFLAIMDARGDRRTLVHCFANFRASAFTFLYRVLREGVPVAEARQDLLAVWDAEVFAENPAWSRFIDDMLMAHGMEAL